MDKKKAVRQTQHIYRQHIAWYYSARTSYNRIILKSSSKIALSYNDEFLKWHKENQRYFSLFENFKNLEMLHNNALSIYNKINTLKKKPIIIRQIVNLFIKKDDVQKENFSSYYNNLTQISKTFLKELKSLEDEIICLPEQ